MIDVEMADGSKYTVSKLLANGDTNTKLRKSNAAQTKYLTVGLSLAPAKTSGYEVCSSRSPGCTKGCLFTAGYGVYEQTQRARIAKTRLFFQNRSVFKEMLFREMEAWRKRAQKQGKVLACRLNVVSDIMWEKIFPDLFVEFSDVQFYDYTKHIMRVLNYAESVFPKNYYLTFSRSEANGTHVDYLIKNKVPVNIAVVFQTNQFPRRWRGRTVVNGDKTDLRFLEGRGKIVGLKAKGRAKHDETGFVILTLDTDKVAK